MSNPIFNTEETIENIKTSAQKQVNQQASATTKIVGDQLTGSGTNETQTAGNPQDDPANADQNTQDFVKDLYGPSMNTTQSHQQNPQQGKPLQDPNGQQPQTPEEAEKLAKARKLLLEQHMSSYYKPTFEPPNPPEEPVAEKLEQQKEQENIEDFQKAEKKKPPLAVQRERNKAEQHRGAAG